MHQKIAKSTNIDQQDSCVSCSQKACKHVLRCADQDKECRLFNWMAYHPLAIRTIQLVIPWESWSQKIYMYLYGDKRAPADTL